MVRLTIWLLLALVVAWPMGSRAGDDNYQQLQGQKVPNVKYPEYPEPDPNAPIGRVGLYFDEAGLQRNLDVEPFKPFDLYLVVHQSPFPVRGWEVKLVLDEHVRILASNVKGINVGAAPSYIVAMPQTDCFEGDTVVLASFQAMLLEPDLHDLVLGVAPAEPSSFHPPSPGFLTCRMPAEMQPYLGCDECAVINPVDHRLPETKQLEDILEPVKGR
jgi:hypothetical protein